jgi:hypothetical protein
MVSWKGELQRTVVLVVLLQLILASTLIVVNHPMLVNAQIISLIDDPTPGYGETSEYMIGSVAVSLILPESNGSIDPSTEDWTSTEEQNVINEVQYALDWWANQNSNASVSFIKEIHLRVPTSYEPINRPVTETYKWISEIMTSLEFPKLSGEIWVDQVRDYVNALRDKLSTDWVFVIFVVDSSNDPDGMFEGGGSARNTPGGPLIYMTYDNGQYGIENMDRVCAHEIGNLFWALDEYVPIAGYNGYLNVTSIPLSGCLMDNLNWSLSGAPYGDSGTWGQVGWHDADSDGIQDIVDTSQQVYLNPSERIGNELNCTGTAAVTPYPNKNPSGNRRNVTINKIQSVQYRVDSGEWLNTTMTPTTLEKQMFYNGTKADVTTYAIVNFTFLTDELLPGNHTIEVKATNQWGNSGCANETVTITQEQNSVAFRITPPNATVYIGTPFSVDFDFENLPQGLEGAGGFWFRLSWNSSILRCESMQDMAFHTVTPQSEWDNLWIFSHVINNTAGYVEYRYYWKDYRPIWNGTYGPISGNGTWATMNFTAIAKGNTTMHLYDVGCGDVYANPIPFKLFDGQVRAKLLGDINSDNTADIYDAILLANAYNSRLGDQNWSLAADLNSDNTVDIYDAILLANNYGKTA